MFPQLPIREPSSRGPVRRWIYTCIPGMVIHLFPLGFSGMDCLHSAKGSRSSRVTRGTRRRCRGGRRGRSRGGGCRAPSRSRRRGSPTNPQGRPVAAARRSYRGCGRPYPGFRRDRRNAVGGRGRRPLGRPRVSSGASPPARARFGLRLHSGRRPMSSPGVVASRPRPPTSSGRSVPTGVAEASCRGPCNRGAWTSMRRPIRSSASGVGTRSRSGFQGASSAPTVGATTAASASTTWPASSCSTSRSARAARSGSSPETVRPRLRGPSRCRGAG